MTDLLDTFNIDLEGDGTHLDKEVEAMEIEMVNQTRTTKKKRKRRSVPETDDLQARESRYQQILGEETLMRLLEDCRKSIKKSFEDEKHERLESLPVDYKKRFGEIAFTRYQKDFLPVLILNPYSVPPGPVRHTWLDVHEKLREEGRMNDLLYVVYWYGTVDENQCYAHIKSKQLLHYESNVKKYRKIPKGIERKLEKGEELSKNQKEEMRKWEEVDDDLQKPPSERKRGVVTFPEVYELVTVNDIADEAEALIAQVQADASNEADEPLDGPGRANQPKKRKKKQKDKRNGGQEIDIEVEIPAEKTQAEPATQHKKPVEEVDSDGIGEEDISSEDDEADDDYVEDKQQRERDRDVKVDKSQKPSLKAKEKKAKGKSKKESVMDATDRDAIDLNDDDNMPRSKSKKAKSAVDKTKGKENKVDADSKKQSATKRNGKKARDAELRKFEQCKKDYYPLVKQISAQVQDNEVSQIVNLLEKLYAVAENLSAPFIRASGLPLLIKSIKPLVKGKEKEFKAWSDLRTKLQDVYSRKLGEVPEGFQAPPIESNEKAQTKSENLLKKDQTFREASEEKSHLVGGTDSVPSRSIDSKQNSQAEGAIPILATTSEQNGSRPDVSKPSATPMKAKPKPERKSFSLGKLMNQKPQENTSSAVPDYPRQKSATPSRASWVSGPCELSLPSGLRFTGYEFLRSVALHFPQGKVDTESFALELENAVYCKYSEESRYWEKLHAICAAIVGKKEPGALSKLIVSGSISSPKVLVDLDEKQLRASFEGGYVDI